MGSLSYEQTIELELNIKIKNEADIIYQKFLKNVKLNPKNYKENGKFLFWSDEHNATYFTIKNDNFYFECRFLHETYDVLVTPSGIFDALKKEYRGVNHLSSAVGENRNYED